MSQLTTQVASTGRAWGLDSSWGTAVFKLSLVFFQLVWNYTIQVRNRFVGGYLTSYFLKFFSVLTYQFVIGYFSHSPKLISYNVIPDCSLVLKFSISLYNSLDPLLITNFFTSTIPVASLWFNYFFSCLSAYCGITVSGCSTLFCILKTTDVFRRR